MSGVNISILEGGKAENFGQVTKLRTSNGTDHDSWVPKSDVETKHLSVKKNGLHYTNQYEPTASEKKDGKFHDVYGWDTITVSVKKKVTGKKKKINPSTGIEYDVPTSVDIDDDGNIVETELPVSIEIEVPPSKLEYHDGENISKAGMIVKAYYADDSEWGTVPLDEITLEPTTASGEGSDEYSDGDGVNAMLVTMVTGVGADPIIVGDKVLGTYSGMPSTIAGLRSESPLGYSFLITRYDDGRNVYNYCKLINGEGFSVHLACFKNGAWEVYGTSSARINSKNSFAAISAFSEYWDNVPISTKNPTEAGEMHPVGGSQTITVKWTPPEGEDELTDTFDITITT